MRLVFALLASCFLVTSIGDDNTLQIQGRLNLHTFEQIGSCALRTAPADSDDDVLPCPCCTTSKPSGILAELSTPSDGHLLDDRWTRTATDGFGIGRGDSITLTWGFVGDGTSVASSGTFEGSSLIETLDDNFSETNTSPDLTQRRWFAVFQGTFERFDNLSGLNFVYEPNDNGATLNGGGRGILGSVADIRIGGRSIDGQSGSNVLAFNFFPDAGDMVLDTDNTNFFDANDTGFRNVVAHEFGHGLGISHLLSNSDRFLLEPFINVSFQGPQHSDILALHHGYGDHFEEGVGNDSVANATPLGDISAFEGVGLDGSLQVVGMTDEDFVSIDGLSDVDVFSFDVIEGADFTLTLTPLGYEYDLAEQAADGSADEATRTTVDTSQLNDLGFVLLDQNGSTLGIASSNGLGAVESLDVSLTPGTYFIEVVGSTDRTQFYSFTSRATVPATQITVATTTAVPTANLLASQPVGGQQYLVDSARDPGQGQTFSLGSDFTLDAITVQIGADNRGAQDTAEDATALILNVYDVSDGFLLDSTTLLGSFGDQAAGTFDATTSLANPLYLTFDLEPTGTAALGMLSANTLYAFTITTNSTVDPGFRIERSSGDEFANGNGIFSGSNNIPSLRSNDDAVFFLQGSGDSVVVGDINGDGEVNFLDIQPFIGILTLGGFEDRADIDRNGSVNFLDIAPFIALLSGQ